MADLFLIAAEPSADLHGSKLVEALLAARPGLKIAAVAGPLMRSLPIEVLFPMESLQAMGFLDVLSALPRIARQFFSIRKKILSLNPKAVVCIDYPGFNLRLEASLRKQGYQGKLIHYVCPTVWAWGKKRIPRMAETLDLLLTLFPFEKECFSSTSLRVEYVGHPLASQILPAETAVQRSGSNILALFPGSREAEIRRNFPLQLAAAKRLLACDPTIQIAISIAQSAFEPLLRSFCTGTPVHFYPFNKKMELMRTARAAIATSGTVTLELALHCVPTVVNFAIRPLDLFIAQKIFHIDLPFYCIVNIMVSKSVFPELFGPRLVPDSLFFWAHKLLVDEQARAEIRAGCTLLRESLGTQDGAEAAAKSVIALAF